MVLFISVSDAKTQDSPHFELWSTYVARKYVPKQRFWLRGDLGIRPDWSETPRTMFLLRARPYFNLGSLWEIIPAFDFRYSVYQNLPNSMELRPWLGIRLDWPQIGRVSFNNFYRFESRTHFNEGEKDGDNSLRSRYRLNMRIPINNPGIVAKTFYVDFRGEAFFSHDDGITEPFASTLRLGVNVGYNHSTKWRYYLTFYVDRGRNSLEGNATVDRYMIELAVRTTFPSKEN
jgi:hypothetical protein